MIGTRIGPLEVTQKLGEGGMGLVFRAEHAMLKTSRVIKVLLPEMTRSPHVVQRFINEARAAASIQHRNIIAVHDVGQLPGGDWYIVMDYLEGATLRRFLHGHGGPLAPHLALPILAQIANGLGAAHARGIIHRDLKPDNIFLTTRDTNERHVVILDFGVAKLTEEGLGAMTQTGQAIGTPAYMPPEQLRGGKVDATCDVFALGVIAYQLVTGGYLPYQDQGTADEFYALPTAEIFHRQMTQQPTDPRRHSAGVPDGWVVAITRALDRDPANRPASTAELALLLAQATPSDGFLPDGLELLKVFAPEILGAGTGSETVRLTVPPTPVVTPALPVPAAASTLSRYQVGTQLGVGGMAEVFVGTMTGAEGFARQVAIKRVLAGFSQVPAFATMFIQEARIASRLGHPNIVTVLDFDRDPEGRLFLVMEYVEGKDLATVMDAGVLPPSIVIFIVTEMLRGLGYAHELPHASSGMRGVIHRDVSPHNVLLSWEGAVKVSDFGIAKAREASAGAQSTEIKGKPAYMSPEQANGEKLDGRSDLFAVGIMLWELLVGQMLFQGSLKETLAQVLFREIPRPSTLRPGVPPDLEAVAMRLLEREVDARYASADHAIADLALCVDNPRDGRGDLVRLLARRFPLEVRARAQRPAKARVAAQLAALPSTLGTAASQKVGPRGPGAGRRSAPVIVGAAALVVGALVVGVILLGPDRARTVAHSSSAGSAVSVRAGGGPDPAGPGAESGSAVAGRPAGSAGAGGGVVGAGGGVGSGGGSGVGPGNGPGPDSGVTVPVGGRGSAAAVTISGVGSGARPAGGGATTTGASSGSAEVASAATRPGGSGSTATGAGSGSAVVAGAGTRSGGTGSGSASGAATRPAGTASTAPVGVGTNVVRVIPWGEVTIGRKSYGQTPVRATLPAGKHRVRVRNDAAGKDEVISVTVEAGGEQVIERNWRE